MLARTRLKLKNAEKSINFMQEQHAKILEGLHQEIDQLQKKNARLAFQLTMNGGENLAGKGDHKLQEALILTGSELAKMKLLLSKEQEKVTLLQSQVGDILSKHSEELLVKEETIKKLGTELDSKADVVVLLTQQIYRLRAKLKQEFDNAASQSAACSCPHCYVHSKVSPEARVLLKTPTQGSNTMNKHFLRTSDIRHQHLIEAPPTSDFSPSRFTTMRNLIPTPPPSSPPLSASGRRRPIFKIASKPDLRTLPSTPDAKNGHISDNTMQPHSSSQDITRRKSQASQHRDQTLVRITSRYGDGIYRKDSRDTEDKSTSQSVCRNSSPTLPPIVAPSTTDFNQHLHNSERDKLPDATFSHRHHKASYLTKFPGLSSAPPASLHVLHHSNRHVQSVEDLGSPEQHEGTLLVKENDEKACDSSWANGTPALDS